MLRLRNERNEVTRMTASRSDEKLEVDATAIEAMFCPVKVYMGNLDWEIGRVGYGTRAF